MPGAMTRGSAGAASSRRPAWAQNALRYNAAINQASKRAGKPGVDFGLDNFAYDPEKVSSWRFPDKIMETNLPQDLYEASKDWVLAGSAIDTAIERIQNLSDEALQRAFPSYTHEHLIASRRTSEQCSSVGGASELSLVHSNASTVASTAATSFSLSGGPFHPPKLNTAFAIHSTKKYAPHPNQLPEAITSKPGMESPPFTPVTRSGSESGSGARSPTLLPKGHKDIIITPNAVELTAHLSPLMSPSSYSSASISDTLEPKPDLLAWTNYINAYTAELRELKKVALPRLRGFEYTISKILFELRAHPPTTLTWQTAEAIFAFAEWWKEAKNMGRDREEVAASMELPRLEDVVGDA